MTYKTFEKALLALRTYQSAKSDNMDELLAIACVFRNRVLKFGHTYTRVLQHVALERGWPEPNNPAMSNPQSGLLAQIDAIYDGDMPDMTSNHLHKEGALYFGRVQDHQGTGDWFEENILKNQAEHPLLGSFGTQQFFE